MSQHRLAPLPLLLLLGLLIGPVDAAEIHLTDGNILTGEVVGQDDQRLVVVIQAGTGSATLTLDRDRVHEVVGQSPTTPATRAEDEDEPGAPARTGAEEIFLTVPIGRLGVDTYAEGLKDVLVHARRMDIDHLVFVIDNTDSWDLDEARRVHGVLARYRDVVDYHAIVENCLGDGLAVVMNCHTMHLAPGARLGGAPLGEESEEDRVMRRAIAQKAGDAMRERGHGGLAVEAMIDPALSLVAYRQADDSIAFAQQRPAGLADDRIVVAVGEDDLLVFDDSHLAAFGMAPYAAGPAELGATLGLQGWTDGGGYAQRQMTRVAERLNKRKEREDQRLQQRLTRVEERRATAAEVLHHSIQQAKHWDPTKGDYATYESYTSRGSWYRGSSGKRRGSWGWTGRHRYRGDSDGGSTVDTKVFTKGSREEWQLRSRNCLRFLDEALRAARSLKKLDRQATELGLEALFEAGQLDLMLKDLQAKRDFVYEQRNRKEK